jgi:hypothetical protein
MHLVHVDLSLNGNEARPNRKNLPPGLVGHCSAARLTASGRMYSTQRICHSEQTPARPAGFRRLVFTLMASPARCRVIDFSDTPPTRKRPHRRPSHDLCPKRAGERGAGNPHTPFDAAGPGTGVVRPSRPFPTLPPSTLIQPCELAALCGQSSFWHGQDLSLGAGVS